MFFSTLFPLFVLTTTRVEPTDLLAALERRSGGRLGVSILDTATGRVVEHRPKERFPLCSTFKLVLAATVLAEVDEGRARLDQRLPLTKVDLVAWSPVCEARVGEGALALGELCAAILTVSDNTAANLLLRFLGGPAVLTAFARRHGDLDFRLDRVEPDLNEARPGDPRDTNTPRAMRKTLQQLLAGPVLSEASRRQLRAWMGASTTGLKRLRAGVPGHWQVLDKTGSGPRGTTNHVAALVPPGRPTVFVTAYLTGATVGDSEREAILAEVGRLAVDLQASSVPPRATLEGPPGAASR